MTHTLIPAYPSSEHWKGIVTTSSGRIFVYFNRDLSDQRPRIAELLLQQHIVPYPDADWNIVYLEKGLLYSFVSIQAVQLGADGSLWILDKGCDTQGCMVKDSAKLIQISLEENKVISIIALNPWLRETSRIKDMRVGREHIFLSDVGEPDLIVIDFRNGTGLRMSAAGSTNENVSFESIDEHSKISEEPVNGGQLALSRDGRHLFYISQSGNLKRYQTEKFFNLSHQARRYFSEGIDVGSVPKGMLGMDRKNNLFLIDKETCRILKVSLNGELSILLEDPVLSNADSVWVDEDNFLWLTMDKKYPPQEWRQEGHSIGFPLYLFKASS